MIMTYAKYLDTGRNERGSIDGSSILGFLALPEFGILFVRLRWR
jgi:hypothetical protein